MSDLPTVMNEGLQPSPWVSVTDAAQQAAVDTGTVRHWYRTGRIPTQRAAGARGAFLVPLEEVLALAAELETPAEPSAPATELETTYWSMQTEAAREEAAEARDQAIEAKNRLGEAEEQLAFLRGQLSEMSEENRNLRQQIETMASQLAVAQSQSGRGPDGIDAGSITDFSWLDRTTAYESPVRRQQPLGPKPSSLPDEGSSSDGPDGSPVGAGVGPSTIYVRDANLGRSEDDAGSMGEDVASNGEAAESAEMAAEHAAADHGYGTHEDDLIPNSDKRGRKRG